MKQPNLKFLSKSFLFCELVVSVLAVNIFLSSDVSADSESSNQICGSEQPNDVACGGTCCEHSNCAGGGEEDCKFCDLQKTCSASACGIRCKDKTACAGGDNNCIFCSNAKTCTESACDIPCADNAACSGGNNNTCKYCTGKDEIEKLCRKTVCGVACTKSASCVGANATTPDSCNYCKSGACSNDACGAQCDSNSNCAGSPTCQFCVAGSDGKKTCIAKAPCGEDCDANPNICSTSDTCKVCRRIVGSSKKRECAAPLACNEKCDTKDFCSSLYSCKYCRQASGTEYKCSGDACGAMCNQPARRTSQCGGNCPFCQTKSGVTACSGNGCGVSCTSNSDCVGAADGCVACRGGGCEKPIGGWIENMKKGNTCAQVCAEVGGVIGKSPWGNECVCGERRYKEANDALGKIVTDKWGYWSKAKIITTPPAKGTIAVGKYCYNPASKRDNDSTDVIAACYCQI